MEDIVLYPGVELEDLQAEVRRTRSEERTPSGNIGAEFRILNSKESVYNAAKARATNEEHEVIELDSDTDVEDNFYAVLQSMKCEETQIRSQQIDATYIDLPILSAIHEIQRPEQSLSNEKRLPPLCRLCAIPSNNMIDLFGPSILHESITKKIRHCLPITVSQSDTISKQVCRLCLERLESCYRFHETVTRAEKQLLLLHEQTSGKPSTETKVARSPSQSNRQHAVVENADTKKKLVRDADGHVNNIETNSLSNLEKDDRTKSSSHENQNGEPFAETRTAASQSKENVYFNAPNSPPLCAAYGEEELESEKVGSETENYFPPISRRPSKSGIKSRRIKTAKSSYSPKKKEPRKYSKEDNCLPCDETIKTHAPAESSVGHKSITCEICREAFQTIEKCQIHAAIHTSTKNYPCCFCNEIFDTRRKRKTHWSKHSAEEAQREMLEGKGLVQGCDLKLYDAFKTQISKDDLLVRQTRRKFRCPDCRRALSSKEALEKHIENCLYRTRRFTCDYCKRLFKWKVNLQNHIRTHTGERPYGCSICPKTFKSRNGMYSHHKVHTGERPFKCCICAKSFMTFFSLKQHNHFVHCETTLYNCTICDKTFKRKHTRDTHMRSHTERTVYKCDLCNAEFSYASGLHNHKKKKHG